MFQSLALEIDCLASPGNYQSALLKLDDMKGLLRNVVALFFGDLEAHRDNMLEDHRRSGSVRISILLRKLVSWLFLLSHIIPRI